MPDPINELGVKTTDGMSDIGPAVAEAIGMLDNALCDEARVTQYLERFAFLWRKIKTNQIFFCEDRSSPGKNVGLKVREQPITHVLHEATGIVLYPVFQIRCVLCDHSVVEEDQLFLGGALEPPSFWRGFGFYLFRVLLPVPAPPAVP